MRVLIADALDPKALQALSDAGFQPITAGGLKPGTVPEAAREAEILVVRSTLVPKALLDELPRLRLIIRAGAGVDTIDVAAAFDRNIQVSNCPGKNADAVAEMALGLLLAVDRRIPDATYALRQGKWAKGELGQGMGLKGRRLGLVGFGAVGQAMARKAKGLEMEVGAYSRSLTDAAARRAGITRYATLLDLAVACDAVSVHIASTPETKELLGVDFFSALKPGALFVNTARGEVVQRDALLAAIRGRGLRAGLDVFAGEPKTGQADFPDPELAALVVGAPHLGASTQQAAEAVAEEVLRIALAFRSTGQAPNRV